VIKLRDWSRAKKHSGSGALYATWTDQMKRPTLVSIKVDKNNANEDNEPLISGDPVDISYVLNGLAQIAWECGWRPSGLANSVAGLISNYKEPKGN
jgi:hypothetical protein